jgi:hypothetical protein
LVLKIASLNHSKNSLRPGNKSKQQNIEILHQLYSPTKRRITGANFVKLNYEILGSQGGAYEDDCVLGCCAVKNVKMLKMTDGSEMLAASIIGNTSAIFYEITRRSIPGDSHLEDVYFATFRTLQFHSSPLNVAHLT